MPRKRWRTQASGYTVPKSGIDSKVPVPAGDYLLVQHALVDFDELSVLSTEAHQQLISDLVEALRFHRCGVKAGKRGVSDKASVQQIFLSDVARALEGAGLPVKRWRKRYDAGDGPSGDAPESFFFRLAREVAEVSGIALSKDLKLPAKRAARHQYGVMSPVMKAAQDAELDRRQQGLKPPHGGNIRQYPPTAKEAEAKPSPRTTARAIADRTRQEEMEMGKKMNAYHASRKPVPQKPTPSKLRLGLK
jgi:hypothetical protein